MAKLKGWPSDLALDREVLASGRGRPGTLCPPAIRAYWLGTPSGASLVVMRLSDFYHPMTILGGLPLNGPPLIQVISIPGFTPSLLVMSLQMLPKGHRDQPDSERGAW